MNTHLPVRSPKPDANGFINIVMGCSTAARVPLVEYLVDDVLLRPIVTQLLEPEWVPWTLDREAQRRYLDSFIAVWYRLGYDFVRFETSLGFPKPLLMA